MSRPRHGFPTPVQELLLQAALLDAERAPAAWSQWLLADHPARTDGDSLRMMPLLCRNLLPVEPDVPHLATLKSIYRHQWVANHRRLHRAGLAVQALEQAGIETMALKGSALAQRRYGDIGVRMMLDVDLLIRPEHALQAAQVLTAAGWRQSIPTDLEVLLPVTNGTLFTDEAAGAVDLHWRALWAPARDDDLWGSAEPIEMGGASTLAPCAADELLIACVHGIWSDGQRIRWVADAVTVLRSAPQLDWDRVIERARARSITPPLREALGYLRSAFDAPVPVTALRSLDGRTVGIPERACHRAWGAPNTAVRTGWLVLEHYRRQRDLPSGRRSLRTYLRCWTAMAWPGEVGRPLGVQLLRRLVRRAWRLAPGRP